jgi:AcrR family transcriptional regulator
MPRVVDHEQRRAGIARAALRLCAREGPSAVTIGQVAAEAQISKSLVQYYFPAKDALLILAARTLSDDITTVVERAARTGRTPAAVLRKVLLALATLDTEQVLAGHAFMAATGADPVVRRLYQDGSAAAVAAMAGLVTAAGGSPNHAASDARTLLAVARSLADARLLGEITSAQASATLDRQLSLMLR